MKSICYKFLPKTENLEMNPSKSQDFIVVTSQSESLSQEFMFLKSSLYR